MGKLAHLTDTIATLSENSKISSDKVSRVLSESVVKAATNAVHDSLSGMTETLTKANTEQDKRLDEVLKVFFQRLSSQIAVFC